MWGPCGDNICSDDDDDDDDDERFDSGHDYDDGKVITSFLCPTWAIWVQKFQPDDDDDDFVDDRIFLDCSGCPWEMERRSVKSIHPRRLLYL